MTQPTGPSASETATPRGISRERALAWMLVVVTGLVLYLCYRVAEPFLPALAWALALAVIAHPVHRRVLRRISWPNVSAGLMVVLVALVIVVPVIFVTQQLIREAASYAQIAQEGITSGRWRAALEENPRTQSVMQWMDSRFGDPTASETDQPASGIDGTDADDGTDTDPEISPTARPAQKSGISPGAESMARAAGFLTQGFGSFLSGTVWIGMQLMITLMSLFFFLRDRHHALAVVRSLLPLSESETDEVFSRVDDTIHATIFGSIIVAFVQGGMGGLMFWMLGLPSPLFWGAVMGLLAVVPVLGTFVIWAPTAAGLAIQGDWGRAAALAAWGLIAIGLIDNLLYPFLVGHRLRFHTLLVFFAMLGGLALFGASGVILGPLLLAIADALLDVWKRRTEYGGTIEKGVASTS